MTTPPKPSDMPEEIWVSAFLYGEAYAVPQELNGCTKYTRAPSAPTGDRKAALDAYQTGSWYHANSIDEMSAFYMSRLPAIREAAKSHGYAIGVHGSTRRDFDLIATPWRDGYSDRDTLAAAIQDAACGIVSNSFDWENKPCGRVAASFPIVWPEFDHYAMKSAGHVDLSIVEAALLTPSEQAPERVTVVKLGDLIEDAMADMSFHENTVGRTRMSTADHYAHYLLNEFKGKPIIIVKDKE